MICQLKHGESFHGYLQVDTMGHHGACGGYHLQPRIPSGYVKIAIENGHKNSEFSH